MPLPNFLVVGAAKCGTTSLHRYLSAHPQVAMSTTKELRFFVNEGLWRRGLRWYAEQFEHADAIGETSPQYSWLPWHPHVAGRIRASLPDVRIIYIVRDPIDRIISQYCHSVDQCRETRSFSQVVASCARRPNMYVDVGLYGAQVEEFFRLFPSEKILVLTAEELSADVDAVLGKIYAFLGVANVPSSNASVQLNVRSEKRRPPLPLVSALHALPSRVREELWRPQILPQRFARTIRAGIRAVGTKIDASPEPREVERLSEFFVDDIRHLRSLTGLSLDCWARFRGL